MGEHGLVTRVLPSRFGSSWTYAGALAGVGQLTPATLHRRVPLSRRSVRDTALYGIVGRPVAHSVSPAMHNAAFRAAGIDAVYLPLPAVDVDDFVTFARAFGVKGASVTIPYKVAIFDRVDEPSALARAHRRDQHRAHRRRRGGRATTPTRTDFSSRCAIGCRSPACARRCSVPAAPPAAWRSAWRRAARA